MSTFDFDVWIDGSPAPAGSKTLGATAKGRVFLRDSAGARRRKWVKAVKAAVRVAWGRDREALDGPLELWVTFVMPRPKSHYRTGRFSADLRPDAPTWHTTKPDATKLLRSTEDAITALRPEDKAVTKGFVWFDDSQIASQYGTKTYGPRPGARIRVKRLDP